MQSFDIQAFTYEQRHGLLPRLTSAFTHCGGWVLDRKTLSPSLLEFRIEIQLHAILDLYAALVSAGLEITRSGHETLTDLCTRRKHMRLALERGQVLALRIEINFLDDVTLHSLLASTGGLA
jgi:hypothetical protein